MAKKVDVDQVERALRASKTSLRASEIARRLGVPRSSINAILHAHLGQRFAKNEDDFTWTVGKPSAPRQLGGDEVRVVAHFAPDGRPLAELCKLLDGAGEEVLVQAFYLRSPIVAKALSRARRRGVVVKALLGCTSTKSRPSRDPADRHGGRKQDVIRDLHDSGVVVFEDQGPTNNHNKCVVIDSSVTVTGGLNFCDFAEENADNMVVIHSRAVALQFRKDWIANQRHWGSPFKEDES